MAAERKIVSFHKCMFDLARASHGPAHGSAHSAHPPPHTDRDTRAQSEYRNREPRTQHALIYTLLTHIASYIGPFICVSGVVSERKSKLL